jgi:hypothetical protein
MMKKIICTLLGTGSLCSLLAQNYQAIHGSPYAGSLGVVTNPAGMHLTPYKWDLTVFAVQGKLATNAINVKNFSAFSPGNATATFKEGNFARYAHSSSDLHLLNARYTFKPGQAIGFGMNLRNYLHLNTSAFNYADTLSNGYNFFKINDGLNSRFNASFTHSSFVELYGSYSRQLWETDGASLSVGITLKVTKGISGAYARLRDIGYRNESVGGQPAYIVSNGSAAYGYYTGYDRTGSAQTGKENVKSFLKPARSFIGADLGIVYVQQNDAGYSNAYGDESDDPTDYNFKIGISLLDIGKNRFQHGLQSRSLQGVYDKSDNRLSVGEFPGVTDLTSFNDSVRNYIVDYKQTNGLFSITSPTRLVLNVDKKLPHNLYVNGELTVNLLSTSADRQLNTRELNLLTITPRWETRTWGLYLPVQYNTQGNLWVGAALKAGPVLLGFHNLGMLKFKRKDVNGGAYLALIIRPGQKRERESGGSGRERGSRKGKSKLDCPKF